MAKGTRKDLTMANIVTYAVWDADSGERFSTTDFESRQSAERERNRLALSYGKDFCLEVWGIDTNGEAHELETD